MTRSHSKPTHSQWEEKVC